MNEDGDSRANATPRSRYTYSVDGLLHASLSSPLDWPQRTTRLERDSLQDYRNRSITGKCSPAELYHENSKLSWESLASMAWSAADGAQLRESYVSLRLRRPNVRSPDVPVQPYSDLTRQAFDVAPDLFYALELFLLTNRSLHLYEPALGYVRIRALTASAAKTTLTAARLLDQTDRPNPDAVLILVGCFPRNEILMGQRGYRSTLVEAGRLTQLLTATSPAYKIEARIQSQFADRILDSTVGVDGVEQSSVAVVEFRLNNQPSGASVPPD